MSKLRMAASALLVLTVYLGFALATAKIGQAIAGGDALEASPPCPCASETPRERMERMNSCDYLLGHGSDEPTKSGRKRK